MPIAQTSSPSFRFSIAGLVVEVVGTRLLRGVGGYRPLLGSGDQPPAVTLRLEQDETLGLGKTAPPNYPAFSSRTGANGETELYRPDAQGTVSADGSAGTFRVSPNASSVDAAIRVTVARALLRHGGLLLHASGIVHGKSAHLFLGESGAGKSTIAALLDELDGVFRIADEIVAVRSIAGRWCAFPVPFMGKVELPASAAHPIESMSLIHHGPSNRIADLGTGDRISGILQCTLAYVTEAQQAQETLDAACGVASKVPMQRLYFEPKPSVARVLGIT